MSIYVSIVTIITTKYYRSGYYKIYFILIEIFSCGIFNRQIKTTITAIKYSKQFILLIYFFGFVQYKL